MLAKYLSEETKLNISIYYVEGDYYKDGNLHTLAWLKILDNDSSNDLSKCSYIVDITGDQFKDKEIFFKNSTPVYVGPGNDFYKLWETKQDIYNPERMYLEPDLILCYEAILEYF